MIKPNDLNELLNNQNLFEFYQYTDQQNEDAGEDVFYVGRLKAYDDKYVLINELDRNGIFGGYALFELNDDSKIVTKSGYLNAISKLHQIAKENIQIKLTSQFPDYLNKNDILNSVLKYLKETTSIFTFETKDEDDEEYHTLADVNGDNLTITMFYFEDYKEKSKETFVLDIDQIDAISFDEFDQLLMTKYISE